MTQSQPQRERRESNPVWVTLELKSGIDLTKLSKSISRLPKSLPVLDSIMPPNPSKGMYERERTYFGDYVFLKVEESRAKEIDSHFTNDGIGRFLRRVGSDAISYLSKEELDWVYEMLRGSNTPDIVEGATVKILSGPYEGYTGKVEKISNASATVLVTLLRSTYRAVVGLTDLSPTT